MTTGWMTVETAQAAGDAWGFNCGPAALCAVFDKSPDEIRPHLLDFEQKGYVNPTLMTDVLTRLRSAWGFGFGVTYKERANGPKVTVAYPQLGLVRVQWGGPWTKPGVPLRARYRHTHWIACRRSIDRGEEAFDVNALCVGGWLPWSEWAGQLVPWLIREAVPRADGTWWPTHVIQIDTPWEDSK